MKNTTKNSFLIGLLITFSLGAFSQSEITDKFLYMHHASDEMPLPYRLFIPDNYDASEPIPLILTLHGRGESGTDNEIQIELNHIATSWANPSFQANHPSFIVSPQCPWDSYWNEPTTINSFFEILDSIIEVYNIDTDRIYITGLSMGGYGTWAALEARPHMFAAAMPVCGAGKPEVVSSFSHVPLWNHHGANDNTVPTSESRDLMAAYEALSLPLVTTDCYKNLCTTTTNEEKQQFIDNNVDLLYSEYKGVSHSSWNNAYTDSLALEWVFSKQRRTKDALEIIDTSDYETLSDNYTINLTSIVDSCMLNVMYSGDLGYTWTQVASNEGLVDSVIINTALIPDAPFGLFKVQQVSSTIVSGTDYSAFKRINNAENGAPFLKYHPSEKLSTVKDDSISFQFLVGDAEEDPMNLSVYYKHDDSSAYELVNTFTMQTQTIYQERFVVMKNLAYGKKARLKFELSDDEHTVIDSTAYFKNSHNLSTIKRDLANSATLKLYPNPSNGQITIELETLDNTPSQIMVINLAGKEVYRATLPSKNTNVDLNHLDKGLYLIHINNGKNAYVKKLLLK